MAHPCLPPKAVQQSPAEPSEGPLGALGTHLLAPGHTISKVVDEVLTVPLNQAVLHYLVDHVFCALDDLVHGEGQVRPVQLVVDLPRAAMQHVLQAAILHHGTVAEDRGDAAHLKLLTWGARTKGEPQGVRAQPLPREALNQTIWIKWTIEDQLS